MITGVASRLKSIKPKVLVFSHICSPQFVTGAEKLLLFMLREMLPSFSCTLIVPNEGIIAEQARKLGIRVIVQNIPLVVSLYLALSHMNDEVSKNTQGPEWAELLFLIHRERPDAIITNTCVHPLPAMAAKSLGVPVIWTVMEALRETPYTSMAVAIFEQYADYVIGISEATLASLRTPVLLPKTTLIPPSWDHAELRPDTWTEQRHLRRSRLGISEGHKLIGYISSSIFEAKGLEHFMQMAVPVAERFPQAMFLIVGNPVDSGYFERCLDHARAKNVLERFRWIRFEEQVETIYPAMDILVVPSLTVEGFGMTALEGMVFGKPVVVYGSGGLTEIGAATGNMAYVVPVGETDGLFGKVSELLGDEALFLSIGARNAQMSIAAFGVDVYRKRLRKFIESLKLQGYNPPRIVRGSTPNVYLFENGVLRPFNSERAFLLKGYSFDQVYQTMDAFIAAFPHGAPIGKLLHRAARGKRSKLRKGSRTRRRRLSAKRSSRRVARRITRSSPGRKQAGHKRAGRKSR
ncbi:glycosyltransferase family 4 protein [Paenibacillus solisilvae]|uniref:Glycosyltransferase family 4 protein n=1 Tax=Paenibacillus solisilvae TaxID=2486751 RepID=A0ABW0W5L1_9BACL